MSDEINKIEMVNRPTGSEREFSENKGYTAHPIHQVQGTPVPPGEPTINVDAQPNSQPATSPNEANGD